MSTAIAKTLDVNTMVLTSYGFEKKNTFFLFKAEGTKIIHCMFEKVVVSADKLGKVDNYIIERSYREIWSSVDN